MSGISEEDAVLLKVGRQRNPSRGIDFSQSLIVEVDFHVALSYRRASLDRHEVRISEDVGRSLAQGWDILFDKSTDGSGALAV